MESLLLYSTTHLHYVGTVTKKMGKKQENLIFYQIFLNSSHLPEINQQQKQSGPKSALRIMDTVSARKAGLESGQDRPPRTYIRPAQTASATAEWEPAPSTRQE